VSKYETKVSIKRALLSYPFMTVSKKDDVHRTALRQTSSSPRRFTRRGSLSFSWSASDITHSSRRASELAALIRAEWSGRERVRTRRKEQGASASGLGPLNPSNQSLCRSSSTAMAAPAPDRAALTVGPGMDMPIMHDSDRYELVRDIGSGNFGVARLMRDRRTMELVAVKYIERGEKVAC
jgi:hypothetical protein